MRARRWMCASDPDVRSDALEPIRLVRNLDVVSRNRNRSDRKTIGRAGVVGLAS